MSVPHLGELSAGRYSLDQVWRNNTIVSKRSLIPESASGLHLRGPSGGEHAAMPAIAVFEKQQTAKIAPSLERAAGRRWAS